MKSKKYKSLWVAGVTFLLTGLVTIFKEFEPGNVNAIWFIWFCVSWNYFAYAFDRRMLPSNYDLDDAGKHPAGPIARAFLFWGTAAIYLAFLAVAAFADQ